MYNKLFAKILDSSIWLEPTPTRIVWITLLAAMDQDGFCAFAAPANLAHRALVPLPEALAAIASLESPDANSGDPDNEGCRIERVPGGWIVRNAVKYREIVSEAESRRLHRERQKRYRERDVSVTPRDATVTRHAVRVTQSEAEADTEAEGNTRDRSLSCKDQDHRADARNAHEVLKRLAHDVLTSSNGAAPSEQAELLKGLAATAGIPYDSGSVTKALDAAAHVRQKAR